MFKRFIAICGPTACGKSAVAVALAKLLKGEVLSFDASQAFVGADIGTAKVTLSEQAGVPHHLLDLLEPDQKLEAGFFMSQAENVFNQVIESHKIPLICAGSSMYLSLFFEGMAQTGQGSPEIRESLESRSNQELYEMLQSVDPARAASLHPNDRLRIVRALEIFSVTGQTVTELFKNQQRQAQYRCLLIILCRSREELALRIEQRVERMLEEGLVDECRRLIIKAGSKAQIFESIGYSETLKYLNGEITEKELRELIALHTKQLAKKQMTFLRRFPARHSFICEPAQDFIKSQSKPSRLDFKALELGLEDLARHCEDYLSCGESLLENRAIYIDAANLLQGIAVR